MSIEIKETTYENFLKQTKNYHSQNILKRKNIKYTFIFGEDDNLYMCAEGIPFRSPYPRWFQFQQNDLPTIDVDIDIHDDSKKELNFKC